MRMSSGPSLEKEKPRSAWSSCIDDANVHRHPIDGQQVAGRQCLVHAAEALLDQSQAPSADGAGDERRAVGDRVRIAIKADYSPCPRPEQGAGIAPCSEGGIDDGIAGGDGQSSDDFIE